MRRRELFSSLTSSFLKNSDSNNKKEASKENIIRPPYYEDEKVFFTNCINCEGKPCSTACEENIILINNDKTVKLDLTISGCSYCDECANACENEVLSINNKNIINAKIEIDILRCLSWNQTMCFSCKDPCLDKAIDFIAMFRPEINTNCTSCGFCIKYCPVEAIKVIG